MIISLESHRPHKLDTRIVSRLPHIPIIQRQNLNLNPHIVLTQPRHSNTSPSRTMIRHPFLEIPCRRSQSLVVDRHVVGVHAEDLRPALASCIFEGEVYVCGGLVDLCVDFLVEHTGFGVPSTCRKRVVSDAFFCRIHPCDFATVPPLVL